MAARVYIVDEDRGTAAGLAHKLEAAGYAAHIFPDADALTRIAPNQPSGWLLLDVGRPGAERIETMRSLRERGCDWPVIAMCAVPDLPLAARSLKAGACDVIAKPFTHTELIGLLEAAEALRD